jgi:hypothetical protein
MLFLALLIVAGVFALLFFTRVGGARRVVVARHWPAIAFAVAAIFALVRGALWPALAFAGLSFAAYVLSPALRRFMAPKPPEAAPETPADREARAILGVPRGASDQQIRAAYRSKMAHSHPDRGGSNAEAARLTAARDRLLKKTG